MPPNNDNLDEWGGAWWTTWTIKELNRYLKVMTDAGISNLLPLPIQVGDHTKWATFMGFTYGG